ncbi:c-type cytochrome [Marixanthomonas spongiae]|uniref:Cytochrome C n=1 Tax=Marixanthomonas spongiae TaxID=2174845 RepID=A0A2U0HSU6_9FLAO|nr:cytochrome c [Marixanthomonas spongiae]PVW11820.1 cytochrome C [Marixanthomonas spongiae]
MKTLAKLSLALSFLCVVGCDWGHGTKNTEDGSQEVDSSKIMHINRPDKAKTGVGPIKEKVELGMHIDQEMAAKGEKLFKRECSTCHEIHDSNKGPALGGVLQERSPQWVMNMILNPGGMIEHNVQVKAMKAEYEYTMVDMDLTEEEARQIVEYLRNY